MGVWGFEDIHGAAGGHWIVEPGSGDRVPMGASIDSREVKCGQVFIAFDGEHVDGHAYIDDAIGRGAAMILVTDPEAVSDSVSLPVLCVDDPVVAMTGLASLWRARIKARVVAVTGSNGKTTTCRMIDAVLSKMGRGSVSQKSFNNQLGVPITVLNAKDDDEYLICELGTSSPGEIAARTALCRPDVAVIVSIGRAHLEELGSRDGVIAEKSQVARGAGIVILPAGIDGLENAVRAQGPGEVLMIDARVEIGMLGEHNKSNAALAAAVGCVFGMEQEAIVDGLSRATPPAMRLERVVVQTTGDPVVVINDAYNANPDSMRASLSVLGDISTGGRRVAVLGDMLELGSSGEA
jgi:UDP-N-acetylmuramoyl-tripeptide--D-alanyl-D-alanine ligase